MLAIGIGANTAVFSLVDALVLHPRPGRIDQLLGIFTHDRVKANHYRDFSYPEYLDLRNRSAVFDSLMAHTFTTVGIREGNITRQSFATVVSSNYFDTLGVHLQAGRSFTADEERPGAGVAVIIASYKAWQRTGFRSVEYPESSAVPAMRRRSPSRVMTIFALSSVRLTCGAFRASRTGTDAE